MQKSLATWLMDSLCQSIFFGLFWLSIITPFLVHARTVEYQVVNNTFKLGHAFHAQIFLCPFGESDKKQMINGWSPFGKQTVSTQALLRKKAMTEQIF